MRKPKKVPDDCMPKCATCAFGEIEGEGGVCHRYPPTFVSDEENGPQSVFAVVAADDWCGEYVRKLQS